MGNISTTEHHNSLLGVSVFFIRNGRGREKEERMRSCSRKDPNSVSVELMRLFKPTKGQTKILK